MMIATTRTHPVGIGVGSQNQVSIFGKGLIKSQLHGSPLFGVWRFYGRKITIGFGLSLHNTYVGEAKRGQRSWYHRDSGAVNGRVNDF